MILHPGVICQSFFSNFSKISKNIFGTAVLGMKIAPSREPNLVDDFATSPSKEPNRQQETPLHVPCRGFMLSVRALRNFPLDKPHARDVHLSCFQNSHELGSLLQRRKPHSFSLPVPQ